MATGKFSENRVKRLLHAQELLASGSLITPAIMEKVAIINQKSGGFIAVLFHAST